MLNDISLHLVKRSRILSVFGDLFSERNAEGDDRRAGYAEQNLAEQAQLVRIHADLIRRVRA